MSDHDQNRVAGLGKAWLVWFCIIVFAGASLAESAHYYSSFGPSEQHCSICIAAHSVARPAPAVSSTPTPTQCIGLLCVDVPTLPDYESVISLYIRPPPVA
jgi:hypothetical protein